MPIPADLSEAFEQAVKELIAWDGSGDEPSVNFDGRPTLISAIAGLPKRTTIQCPRTYSGAWLVTQIALITCRVRAN